MLIILSEYYDENDHDELTPGLITMTAIIWGCWVIFCASLAGIALL